MGWNTIKKALTALAAAVVVGCATVSVDQGDDTRVWVGSWATSQQIPEPENALDPADMRDATLRQIVRLTAGGERIRVRVSNVFGTQSLHFAAVRVARRLEPGSAKIDVSSDRAVTFGGRTDVIVPAGAEYISDPVALAVAPLADLAVSIRFTEAPAQQTGHPGSRMVSFIQHGDHVSAADMPDAKRVEHWYQLAAIEVEASPGVAAIAIVGDSITDGRGSTTNMNNRWPDIFARRLQENAATQHYSVLNLGVGGNRLLRDGKGPNALARFDRDVLAQSGVTHVIVLEGVNDLGTLTSGGDVSAEVHERERLRMIGVYEQMIERAHAHGMRIYGATIMPVVGFPAYNPPPATEADRQFVNNWIRTSGRFDAVIDFDAIMRDPANPSMFNPPYDMGDKLHPNAEGHRAMGEAVPLTLFAE